MHVGTENARKSKESGPLGESRQIPIATSFIQQRRNVELGIDRKKKKKSQQICQLLSTIGRLDL